jgi:hypothetical protein
LPTPSLLPHRRRANDDFPAWRQLALRRNL